MKKRTCEVRGRRHASGRLQFFLNAQVAVTSSLVTLYGGETKTSS